MIVVAMLMSMMDGWLTMVMTMGRTMMALPAMLMAVVTAIIVGDADDGDDDAHYDGDGQS